MAKCTYCWKDFLDKELKPLREDDSPHLNRKYCPRCYPDVQKDHDNLPWNQKKWKSY